MGDIALFYYTVKTIEEAEKQKREAEAILKANYDALISLCPHSETIQFQFNHRGWGPYRVCKICGIEDQASEGGTSGDEYDYGTAGRPSKTFWKNAEVEITKDENRFNSFRRQHGWLVRNGRAYKWGVTK